MEGRSALALKHQDERTEIHTQLLAYKPVYYLAIYAENQYIEQKIQRLDKITLLRVYRND